MGHKRLGNKTPRSEVYHMDYIARIIMKHTHSTLSQTVSFIANSIYCVFQLMCTYTL
jgi:hypothetical protein